MTRLEAEVCRVNCVPVCFGVTNPIKYYIEGVWLQTDGKWWASIYQCDDNTPNGLPSMFSVKTELLYYGDVPR